MLPLEKHEEEIVWLKRRLAYLEQIHLLSKRTYSETLIAKITPHYSKVATPRHLVERIEEVYDGNLS
jgi:hypothetical protein